MKILEFILKILTSQEFSPLCGRAYYMGILITTVYPISPVIYKDESLWQSKLKGTDHDFCWSGKPIYHLQKQGNIHIFQNKYQNPHKFAEIMKKNRVFGKFHS